MKKQICLLTVLFQLLYVVGFAAVVMMGGAGSSGSGGGGGSTFLSDSFTEASSTPLENHTPETGGTWGGDATYLVVESNGTLQVEDNNARYVAFNSAAPAGNTYSVSVTGTCGGGTASTDEFGAIGRWDNSSGIDGYQCKLKGNGYLVLRAYESGTLVDLNGASGKDITSWFSASAEYTTKLIMAGDSYGDISCEVYEGATLKDSDTAVSHTVETRTGKAGVHIYQGNASITSIEAVDQ
jgi:hypothetical protein